MKNLNDLARKRKISEDSELKVLKDTAFQLGRVLERARTIKGKTQSELAAEIGSTQSVIAKIENGSKLPSFLFLQRIANSFGTFLIPPRFGFMDETIVQVRIVDWYMGGGASVKTRGGMTSDSRIRDLTNTINYAQQ